jgi:chemotaxis protein MotB
LPNGLLIEGHTDSIPYDNARYSNWELSADRANAARRIMQENGVRVNQIAQVRGFADQHLRLPAKPEDPSNRRISIIVQFLPGHETESVAGPAAASAAKPVAEHAH